MGVVVGVAVGLGGEEGGAEVGYLGACLLEEVGVPGGHGGRAGDEASLGVPPVVCAVLGPRVGEMEWRRLVLVVRYKCAVGN